MYYIVPRNVFLQTHNLGHVAGAHYIDLPDGENILLKAKFHNETQVNLFENHPNVVALPHPATNRQVGATVAKHLAHIGVQENHSTYDVADLAAKLHPMMKYRG